MNPRSRLRGLRPLRASLAATLLGSLFAGRAEAQTSFAARGAPVAPEQRETASVIARAGAGADSNVNRDPDASARGGLVRADVRGNVEPMKDLSFVFDAAFEGDIAPTFVYQAAAGLIGTYRRALIDRLSIDLGSFTQLLRETTVYVNGRLLSNGAVPRTFIDERFSASLRYALGAVDLEAGARGEIGKGTLRCSAGQPNCAGEDYTLIGAEGSGGARVIILPKHLSFRARYTYDTQFYNGLPARDVLGEIAPGAGSVRLGIHGLRTTLRIQPSRKVSGAIRFDNEWIRDRFQGYLEGNRQVIRSDAYITIDPFAAELGVELAFRKYSQRTVNPDEALRERDPLSERTFHAWIDTDIWLGRSFGIYLRYQIERVSGDPIGTVYFRQLVTVGPSWRMQLTTSE